MKGLFFISAIILSIPLTLASPLPREAPFFIAAASLAVLPRGHALLLAVFAGVLVDLFSPFKGLSAIFYPMGVLCAAILERHLLTNRSFFAFLFLIFCSGLLVMLGKFAGSYIIQTFGGIDGNGVLLNTHVAKLYLRSALLNVPFSFLLYLIVRYQQRQTL